jgi:hypothetical protein
VPEVKQTFKYEIKFHYGVTEEVEAYDYTWGSGEDAGSIWFEDTTGDTILEVSTPCVRWVKKIS